MIFIIIMWVGLNHFSGLYLGLVEDIRFINPFILICLPLSSYSLASNPLPAIASIAAFIAFMANVSFVLYILILSARFNLENPNLFNVFSSISSWHVKYSTIIPLFIDILVLSLKSLYFTRWVWSIILFLLAFGYKPFSPFSRILSYIMLLYFESNNIKSYPFFIPQVSHILLNS